jgi:mono/diheme cytochrome c family protein
VLSLAGLKQSCISEPVKRLLKILGIGLVLGIVLVGGVAAWFAAKWPPTYENVPEPAITASDDPEVIARGDYLFHAVAHCGACHATRQDVWDLEPGAKIVPRGGGEWQMGPLGTIRSPNLTSDGGTGMGELSDGQIARAIRHNVKADHTPATFMIGVGAMSDEDLTAIVSYMRTIPAVSNAVAPNEIGLMGKMLFQGPMGFFAAPKDYPIPQFVKEGGVSVERGRYLFEGPAFCAGCHSDLAWDGETLAFAGQIGSGRVDPSFPDEVDPSFVFVAPNLTPESTTGGLYGWSEAQFIERMRAGRMFEATPMPWENYRLMTDDDLKSIWAYMQQLPPTEKFIGPSRVEKDKVPK